MSLYEMNYRALSAVTEDPNGEELGSFYMKNNPFKTNLNIPQ